MKISLVMDAASPTFMQQACELDGFLQRSNIGAVEVRLCLFYHASIPEKLPVLSASFSGVCWIQTPENAPTETMILPLLAHCQLENPELVLFPGLMGSRAGRQAGLPHGRRFCRWGSARRRG